MKPPDDDPTASMTADQADKFGAYLRRKMTDTALEMLGLLGVLTVIVDHVGASWQGIAAAGFLAFLGVTDAIYYAALARSLERLRARHPRS